MFWLLATLNGAVDLLGTISKCCWKKILLKGNLLRFCFSFLFFYLSARVYTCSDHSELKQHVIKLCVCTFHRLTLKFLKTKCNEYVSVLFVRLCFWRAFILPVVCWKCHRNDTLNIPQTRFWQANGNKYISINKNVRALTGRCKRFEHESKPTLKT